MSCFKIKKGNNCYSLFIPVFLFLLGCELQPVPHSFDLSRTHLIVQSLIANNEATLVRFNFKEYLSVNSIESVFIEHKAGKDTLSYVGGLDGGRKWGSGKYDAYGEARSFSTRNGDSVYFFHPSTNVADWDYQYFGYGNEEVPTISRPFQYYQFVYRHDTVRFVEKEQYKLVVHTKDKGIVSAEAKMPEGITILDFNLKPKEKKGWLKVRLPKGVHYYRVKVFARSGQGTWRGHYKYDSEWEIRESKINSISVASDKDTTLILHEKPSLGEPFTVASKQVMVYVETFSRQFAEASERLIKRGEEPLVPFGVFFTDDVDYKTISTVNNGLGIFTLINRQKKTKQF